MKIPKNEKQAIKTKNYININKSQQGELGPTAQDRGVPPSEADCSGVVARKGRRMLAFCPHLLFYLGHSEVQY